MKVKFAGMSISELSFFVFWSLLMIGKGLGYVGSDTNFKIILLIAIPFYCLKFILTKWKKRELCMCVILLLLGCIQLFYIGDETFVLSVASIIAMKDIDVFRILKWSLFIRMTMFLTRSTLAILGLIEMDYFFRYTDGTIMVRKALGFGMPNSTHYFLFSIVALLVVVYQKRIKLVHYILIFLYNCFVFSYTDSRTGFLMTTVVIILAYMMDKNRINNLEKIIWKIGSKIYFLLALVSIAIPIIISKIPVLARLGTMSSRFLSATHIINNNSISLFGTQGIITDFGFVNILYSNGVVIWILFIIANTILMGIFNRNKLYYEELILCCYAIYSLMEAYTLSILMNMSLIWLVFVLYPESGMLTRYKNKIEREH